MARLFDDAQSEYLSRNQAVLTGTPLAMVCWFNSNDDAAIQVCIGSGSDITVNDRFTMYLRGDTAGDPVQAHVRQNGVGDFWAISTSGYTANTWHHACAIFASTTDRRAFIDGGSKGTNATNVIPANLNKISIGAVTGGIPANFMSGMIAEAAIYDLSVWPGANDVERADNFEKILPSLANSDTPDNYPLGLVAYWDLIRGLNDKFGGYNLTASGTVVSTHPRIIQPHGVL